MRSSCSGFATIAVSLHHLDGHEMVKFMTWAQGILTLQPGVSALVADAHPIFKAHLFLGMTIFLVFPFTRLVHVWSAPIWYLGRRGYQVVRTRRAARAMHRRSGRDDTARSTRNSRPASRSPSASTALPLRATPSSAKCSTIRRRNRSRPGSRRRGRW